MSDWLIKIGRQPLAKKAIKTLGLPIPMPQALRRAKSPYKEAALEGVKVCLEAEANSKVSEVVLSVLKASGASVSLYPTQTLTKEKYDALVYDATALDEPMNLQKVYDFYHTMLRSLAVNGRVLVLARPPYHSSSPKAAATLRALTGFVKSLGKEIGKRGATAQVLYIERDAEGQLASPLLFFLSERSCFVSGQPLRVTNLGKGTYSKLQSSPFSGKTALVTGALRGIGNAIATQLANEGAKVIVVDLDRDAAELETFAKSIAGIALPLNIMEPSAAAKIVQVVNGQGGLDILVHNAGITKDKTLQNMPPEAWNQTIGINLNAIIETTEALLASGLKKDARIICLSSIGGIAGVFGQTNYGASKAGVIGYVKALAKKIATTGTTINAIAPGFIETRMTKAMPFSVREVGRRFNALSQGGLPEDVAQAVTFLALPQSGGVNGQVVRVCGLNMLGA